MVKYDGLAGGKGVKVAGDHLHSHDEALIYCEELIKKGGHFLIERKLIGEEFSLMSFCDGENFSHMPAVQDHKRAYEGDTGPNTGGMGAYSPATIFNSKIKQQVDNEIIIPTLKALQKSGNPYKGILYAGLMIKDGYAKLVEYNIRFGDPECQVLMLRMKNDIVQLILDCYQFFYVGFD